MTAATRSELIEQVAWERLRAALFRHDAERSVGSWLERQRARSKWSAAFLGDEPTPVDSGEDRP